MFRVDILLVLVSSGEFRALSSFSCAEYVLTLLSLFLQLRCRFYSRTDASLILQKMLTKYLPPLSPLPIQLGLRVAMERNAEQVAAKKA